MKLLLPSLYLAPLSYYSILKDKEQVIEQYEFYEKQTYRNRSEIYGANGKLNLIVPISHGGVKKTMKEVKINYDNPWQKIHWKSIQSAYRTSSYFEFYEDDFAPFFEKKEVYLFDLNTKLHELILSLLQLENKSTLSSEYIANPENLNDLRLRFSPKKKEGFSTDKYNQVFSNRHGFIPNLSIIDLLFNQGPASITLL